MQYIIDRLADSEESAWKSDARYGRKIDAIKKLREQYNYTILEGKQIVDAYSDKNPNIVSTKYLANGDTVRITMTSERKCIVEHLSTISLAKGVTVQEAEAIANGMVNAYAMVYKKD